MCGIFATINAIINRFTSKKKRLKMASKGGDTVNQLAEARHAAGMTQQELANEVGVTRKHISAIECGKVLPSVPFSLRICEVLGLDVGEFLNNLVKGKDHGGNTRI